MLAMKFLLLLLLAAPVLTQDIKQSIKDFEDSSLYSVKHDKFAGKTTVCFMTFTSRKTTVRVCTVLKPNGFDYWIMFTGDHLFSHHKLKLLIDGDLVEVGDTGIGYTAAVFVSSATWNKIAQAKVVEFQLANIEGNFNDRTIRAVRNLRTLTR